MNPLINNPRPYEVCPGYSPDLFVETFLTSKPITIDQFCKNEHISLFDFTRMTKEIVTEWELTEQTHTEYSDAVRHLINHLRIKHRNEQYDNNRKGRKSSGGDTKPAGRMADIAEEILRQSAGRNHP